MKRPYSCWLAWHPDIEDYCGDSAPMADPSCGPWTAPADYKCDSIRCRGGRIVWVRVVPQKPKARKVKK